MSVYLPAGSCERTVFSVPEVYDTDVLSVLSSSATAVSPCFAVTPLRSLPSLDLTVSLAPGSSLAVPPLISCLLIVAVMTLSVMSTEATSFSSTVTLPSLSTVKPIDVAFV